MRLLHHCLFAVSTLLSASLYAQLSKEEINARRVEHARHLSDTVYHVLKQDEIEEFGGLDYFDFDSSYQVPATFVKDKGKVFEMPTSTDRLPKYRRYGYFYFKINNQPCTLEVYQSLSLKKIKEYKNHLFLPFKDKTSTKETYGGGRFIELDIPEESFILDFNTAFNPYCAYSYRYSCPIPPEANHLDVEIRAGEKTPLGH